MPCIENLVRPNIKTLQPYSSARDEFSGKEGVFLDANENPFGTWNRYPDPHQAELKTAIARLRSVNPEQVFIGNGSDEVIDLLFRIFCRPGLDKALCFTPTYGMYAVAAAINDVAMLQLPLSSGFQLDTDHLAPVLGDPSLKLVFLCSPNNPTGNCIRDIPFLLQQFKGIVVVDEAYIDFTGNKSMLEQLDAYPNLVVVQTLSKAWGLAGLRIGLAFGAPAVIGYLNKVKPPYNISAPNQQMALKVLEDITAFEERKNLLLQQKQWLEQELAALAIIRKVYPSEANFFLVATENADEIYRELVRQQIITRNRNSVMPGCIRITVGSPEENRQLINALKAMEIPL